MLIMTGLKMVEKEIKFDTESIIPVMEIYETGKPVVRKQLWDDSGGDAMAIRKTNKDSFFDFLQKETKKIKKDINNLSGVYGYMEGSTYGKITDNELENTMNAAYRYTGVDGSGFPSYKVTTGGTTGGGLINTPYSNGWTYTTPDDSTIHYTGNNIVYVDSMEDMTIVAAETRLKELKRMERMKKWKRSKRIDKIILLLVEMKILKRKINFFEYIKLKGKIGEIIK